MGIPPLGGFFSKYAVIAGAAATGHTWITLAYVATAVLTIIYLFRVFVMVFMGQSKLGVVAEGSPLMVFSVALLAVLSVVSGIFITPSFGFAEAAVQQMLGVIK
jgi:NADH:ubiquinone oxidoreductase subunit 5 (subunit L)/multisubunit Na+/H+ antiporter MnhA subunit